eukprot:scaffold15514_cov129-Cylindrotheca_fusiformis.AAC.3
MRQLDRYSRLHPSPCGYTISYFPVYAFVRGYTYCDPTCFSSTSPTPVAVKRGMRACCLKEAARSVLYKEPKVLNGRINLHQPWRSSVTTQSHDHLPKHWQGGSSICLYLIKQRDLSSQTAPTECMDFRVHQQDSTWNRRTTVNPPCTQIQSDAVLYAAYIQYLRKHDSFSRFHVEATESITPSCVPMRIVRREVS